MDTKTHGPKAISGMLNKGLPLEKAVEVLRSGGIVAFPTDTYYGLGCDVFNESAAARVFRAKGRPAGTPLPALLSGVEDVDLVCSERPPGLEILAARYWPGPLTIACKAKETVAVGVTGGLGTVGMRVPDHDVPRSVVRMLGRPISGTSANRSGKPPHKTAAEVQNDIGGEVDLVIPGECGSHPAASTVIDLSGERPVVVREGAIAVVEIAALLPGVTVRGKA